MTVITFANHPIKEIGKSKITILKNNKKEDLFIREDFLGGEEPSVIWLDNKTAIEVATWILDIVEEFEDEEN
jgi:hypothetical protein